MKASTRDVWTLEDVASYLGCSKPSVVKLTREQALPAVRVGVLWRFRRADVIRWMEEQAKKGAA